VRHESAVTGGDGRHQVESDTLRRTTRALQFAIIGVAAGLLALPRPPALVEQYYARWFYPAVQAQLTSWSNTTRFSLFDVLLAGLALALVIGWARCLAGAWRQRSIGNVGHGVWRTAVLAAALYLWFALAWGLNYSRAPIEAAIGYDAAQVTTNSLRALAERATAGVNETYAAAHQAGFAGPFETPGALASALHEVERRLGRGRPTTPGRPKQTLFAHFFRASGVDGMHAPFVLETLLNPDLTPPERPAVLAHEWAHMSGYAPEADASFVGLLAALRADPSSRYSAWLTIFEHAVGQLPRADQRHFVERLDPGPHADRRAIRERLEARVEVVARASWTTYDQYLKSQGVEEGVESYSRVVQLLLGSNAVDWP
jgi:hypothetical protein